MYGVYTSDSCNRFSLFSGKYYYVNTLVDVVFDEMLHSFDLLTHEYQRSIIKSFSDD